MNGLGNNRILLKIAGRILTCCALGFVLYCLSFTAFYGFGVRESRSQAQQRTHPPTWINEHGKQYEQTPDLCMACHGEALDGGTVAKIPCNLCHLLPKHPPNWKEEHGPTYLKDKSQCITCHTKQPFSGRKRPWTMNCIRCHSINADPSRWQQESHTSQIYINSSNSGMIYEDRFGEQNFVSDNYFGVNYSERSKRITFSSQARLSREWLHDTQNLDLYEATLQIDNLLKNHVNLSLGRQPFLSNVDYFLVDGVNVNVVPSRFFDVDLYAGIPRYIEREDLSGEAGLVTGMNLSFKSNKTYSNARIGFSYQKQSFDNGGWNVTDKMYLSALLSQGISIFKFYGMGEYDLTSELVQTATIGAEIYPFSKKIGFLIEGSRFDESRSDNLESVFTFFSVDALWQAKGGVFFNLVKNLNVYQNFAYQRYDVLTDQSRIGLNSESGFNFYFEKLRLETGASYFMIKSYGGLLHGTRLNLYETWSDRFYSGLVFDYVTYDKVTNDNNNGLSVALTSGVKFLSGLNLSATVETITNDVFVNDVRGLFRLDYIFNKKFLEFDKKKAARDEAKKAADAEGAK